MDYSLAETTARVREWQYLTGAEISALDRDRTVVVLTCSPLEVHGPHLPVITDNYEGEAVALRALEMVSARRDDIEFVHLPPLYIANDVLPHHGSVKFRSSTIIKVVTDLGRSLAAQGFKHVVISSFHGGPRHFVPLETACARVSKRYGIRMVSAFSLMISRLTKGGTDLSDVLGKIDGLDAAVLEGDTHGGIVETSMLLHLLGDYVGPHKDMPRRTTGIKLAEEGKAPLSQDNVFQLLRGFPIKLKYYVDETYAGAPAGATAEIGRQIIDVLAKYTADALLDVYDGKTPLSECRSPLWPMRFVFNNDTIHWLFEKAVGYRNRVW